MYRFSLLAFLALGAMACGSSAYADESDGWLQLFNGKDLTGWKMAPKPGNGISELTEKKVDGKVVAFEGTVKGKKIPLWRVEDGTIIGGGPSTHLFSERGDYVDFHYRVE